MKYTTLQVINNISTVHDLRYTSFKDGKTITAFYNQNGGISIGNANLNLSKVVMDLEWELAYKTCSFMEAINSGKEIKHESWIVFKSVQEALYDLLDFKIDDAIKMMNGNWNMR